MKSTKCLQTCPSLSNPKLLCPWNWNVSHYFIKNRNGASWLLIKLHFTPYIYYTSIFVSVNWNSSYQRQSIEHTDIRELILYQPLSTITVLPTRTPALVIEMVCCSIASWMATWSLGSILSNSSMQHTPLSANIRAPASITNSWDSSSFTTAAVKPGQRETCLNALLSVTEWSRKKSSVYFIFLKSKTQ